MATKIQVRRDTAANWTSVNPTLSAGEWGLETDTGRAKLGDGATAWATLAYKTMDALTLATITGGMTAKAMPIDADKIGFWDSVTSAMRNFTFANLWTWIQAKIHGATAKDTPIDADSIAGINSAASNVVTRFTFANLWVWVQAKIHGAANKDALVDADKFAIIDTEASNVVKTTTWSNLKAKILTAIGKVNAAIGFTLAGGATSKTLTVSADADTVNVPTTNEKTRLSDIQAATGATTALKLANLASPASTTQQGVTTLAADGGTTAGTVVQANDYRINLLDYNAESALTKFRAALAKLDSGTVSKYNVCFLGDSITEGVGSDSTAANYLVYSFIAKLRGKIAAKYGDVGKGLIPSFYASQISYTGTWVDFTLIGIAGYSKYTVTENSYITVTFNGTGLDLVTYVAAAANRGNVGVAIDGGAENLISLVNETAQIAIVNLVDGLDDGAHTAVIRNAESSASKEFHVIGIREKKGASGIILNMCGKAGIKVANAITNAYIMSAEIDIWQPVLTVISIITNDIGASTALATYQSQLQTLITRAKAFGDVLLVANNLREDISAATQNQYVDILKALALANNCAFLNIYRRWGFAGSVNGLMDDILHPNKAGHQEIANALSRVFLQINV